MEKLHPLPPHRKNPNKKLKNYDPFITILAIPHKLIINNPNYEFSKQEITA